MNEGRGNVKCEKEKEKKRLREKRKSLYKVLNTNNPLIS
jgi:hypothetical protein